MTEDMRVEKEKLEEGFHDRLSEQLRSGAHRLIEEPLGAELHRFTI